MESTDPTPMTPATVARSLSMFGRDFMEGHGNRNPNTLTDLKKKMTTTENENPLQKLTEELITMAADVVEDYENPEDTMVTKITTEAVKLTGIITECL